MSDAPRRQLGGLSALDRMRGSTSGSPSTPAPAPIAPPAPQTAAVAVELATPAPQPAAAPPVTPPPPKAAVAAPQTAQKARSAAPRSSARPAAPTPQRGVQRAAEDSPRDRVSAYVAADTANRAKNAFRATGHLEGDDSFSDFIEKAIIRELERRERAHNGGNPYSSDAGRLSAGRPLGS